MIFGSFETPDSRQVAVRLDLIEAVVAQADGREGPASVDVFMRGGGIHTIHGHTIESFLKAVFSGIRTARQQGQTQIVVPGPMPKAG